MPYAVTLRLDPAAAARVERIWHALADLIGEDDALRLGYPPHLTLAVLPDTAPAPSVEAAVLRMAAAWDALPVTLTGLAVFPGTPPVLWAAPVPSDGLLARHGMLHAALALLPVYPRTTDRAAGCPMSPWPRRGARRPRGCWTRHSRPGRGRSRAASAGSSSCASGRWWCCAARTCHR
jgi:hypothetical protein